MAPMYRRSLSDFTSSGSGVHRIGIICQLICNLPSKMVKIAVTTLLVSGRHHDHSFEHHLHMPAQFFSTSLLYEAIDFVSTEPDYDSVLQFVALVALHPLGFSKFLLYHCEFLFPFPIR